MALPGVTNLAIAAPKHLSYGAFVYPVALLLHSWLRWLVLALALLLILSSLIALGRRRAWAAKHERVHRLFLAAFDAQVLLGLVLYGLLSPLVSAALGNFGLAMKDAVLRFYAVEHIFGMTVALVVAHVARARSKRRGDHFRRHRVVLSSTLACLLIIVATVPWPGLGFAHERPLLRAP